MVKAKQREETCRPTSDKWRLELFEKSTIRKARQTAAAAEFDTLLTCVLVKKSAIGVGRTRSFATGHVQRRLDLMEEGTKTKKTVFVGGIGDEVDEALLLETFSTFGTFI